MRRAGTAIVLLAAAASAFAQTGPASTPTPSATAAVDPAASLIVAGDRDAVQFRWKDRLKAGCSATAKSGTVTTFITNRKGTAVIAVMGNKPIRDIRRDWIENRRMQDWGMIHDADRDGLIDQVVFNIGPLPMEPADTTNLPSITGKEISADAFLALFQNSRTAYWQVLDLDRDGQLDRLALPAERKSNGWHSGWAVLGLGAAEGQCRVLDKDGIDRGACSLSADGQTVEGEAVTAYRWVLRPQITLDLFREAAQSCKLRLADLQP